MTQGQLIFYLASDFPNLLGQYIILLIATVDPVTNDLASAGQKKSLVTESRWSQEWVFAVKIASAGLAQYRANDGDIHPPLTGSHCGSKHAVAATFQCLF